jgi:sugar phosphate isomerase/epimerase
MANPLPRRKFVTTLLGLPVFASAAAITPTGDAPTSAAPPTPGLKTSLNAFSFNAPLTAGTMTLGDLLDFAAAAGFQGVDLTGYYFKGYPQVPDDDYLFELKRKALRLGLGISGTGVRNDFTIADETRRAAEVQLVKNWIEVAAKLGAPVIRVFAGNQKNDAVDPPKILEWLMNDLRTCAGYGKKYGVVVGLQNHNDFIQKAEQVDTIVEAIGSEWLGHILDTGSYRIGDPYQQIALSAKYAVNWQIKEKIFVNGAEVDTDLGKLLDIIKAAGYKGYLPIETLGDGDPKPKVMALLEKLNHVLS